MLQYNVNSIYELYSIVYMTITLRMVLKNRSLPSGCCSGAESTSNSDLSSLLRYLKHIQPSQTPSLKVISIPSASPPTETYSTLLFLPSPPTLPSAFLFLRFLILPSPLSPAKSAASSAPTLSKSKILL